MSPTRTALPDLPQARWIADPRIVAGDAEATVWVNDAEGVVNALQLGIGKSLLPSAIGDAVLGLILSRGAQIKHRALYPETSRTFPTGG